MKQIQFSFSDEQALENELIKINQWYRGNLASTVLFQIYTEYLDENRMIQICRKIRSILPQSLCVGCTSNGNIIYGNKSDHATAVICTIFEYPSTKVEIFQYPLSQDNEVEVVEKITNEISARQWVKAVMFLATIRDMSMTMLCEKLSELPEHIQVFGGGAFSEDINTTNAGVFSTVGTYRNGSIVFILFGGDDLSIDSSFITGWKPLGLEFNITKSEGYLLKEINDMPAYDTYYKYLHINNDENFFNNTLEFPFLYEEHGIEIMRAPIASNPDGSLVMTSDISNGVKAHIAYGDPWTILSEVKQKAESLRFFTPDCIFVFSCAARRTFWGNEEVGKETEAYQSIAPTSGFYTSGEFVRTGHFVNQHNVTQVVIAMREGKVRTYTAPYKIKNVSSEGKISMINRMATFISATSEELARVNERLLEMAITDGLTGLYNRREIQRRITEAHNEHNDEDVFLLMADLDNFKRVNDTYGHDEGDAVLQGFAKVLLSFKNDKRISFGRWGGEEFMMLCLDFSKKEASGLADHIRHMLKTVKFEEADYVTVSIGYAQMDFSKPCDDSVRMADDALYYAKRNGKDQIVWFGDIET